MIIMRDIANLRWSVRADLGLLSVSVIMDLCEDDD